MERVAQTVVLRNISWETYQRLLKERGRDTQPRYNYHLGKLEISIPSAEHERVKQMVAALVASVAAGLGIHVEACERVTFQEENLDSGFEPDACYYIENPGVIRARKRVDLTEDPVPDLAIEVDLGGPSLQKLPIFATLGVPEVWRYSADGITIHKLAGDEYHELPASEVLPGVARVALTQRLLDRLERKTSVLAMEQP